QGRSDLYVGAGVTLPFAGDWSLSVDLNGRLWGVARNAQLDLPLVVQLSLGRLFHFEGGERDEETSASEPNAADVEDAVAHGEAVALLPARGKWTVFDFWAPWCEGCQTLALDLKQLAAQQQDLAIRRVNIVDFDSPIARQELRDVTLLPHVRVLDPRG